MGLDKNASTSLKTTLCENSQNQEVWKTCSCFSFCESSLSNKALGIQPIKYIAGLSPFLHRTEKVLFTCLGYLFIITESQKWRHFSPRGIFFLEVPDFEAEVANLDSFPWNQTVIRAACHDHKLMSFLIFLSSTFL